MIESDFPPVSVLDAICVPVWFGSVRVESDGESVQIDDNLSLKRTQFEMPKDDNKERSKFVTVAANDRFMFFLTTNSLYAFELRTEAFFRIGPNKRTDEFENFAGAAEDEWVRVEVRMVHSQLTPSSGSSAIPLAHQFGHWDALRGQKGTEKFQEPLSGEFKQHFLVCTAFGAFLATNFDDRAVLERFCDLRLSKNSMETKKFDLPFRIGKICAGRDHLTILDSSRGEIWCFGTGTRGELGTGRLESDNWAEGPKRITSLSEAGIRCVDIDCGAWHSIALTAEGDVYGWGWNGHGQIGHSAAEFAAIQPMPFPFDLGDGKVIAIRCTANNSFLLLSDGNELAFGEICTETNEQMAQIPKNNGTNGQESGKKKGQCQEGEDEDGEDGDGQNSAPKRQRQQRILRVAVVGCSHGQLDAIYERLHQLETSQGAKFDLLICCGDFQALRNHGDLHYFHAPFHHRKLGTFYKYYSGEKVAPLLTCFVGGNHESSAFMAELPNGGWVAPNIFYMGYASVVQFAGLRIGGLSGIFKPGDYNRGHFERPPFRERGSVVSAYHVRSVEHFRLRHLKDGPPLDIFFSHDWPAGITDFGDWETLLRIKPHFGDDVRNGRLGNPATMSLLHELKPARWLAAHLHVHFTAVVPHSAVHCVGSAPTRFLALDKPNDNPRRRFIDILHIPIAEDASMDLCYDPQWLAILRSTDHLTEFTERTVFMPAAVSPPNSAEIDSLRHLFGPDFRIPLNFHHTAPPEREPWNCKGRPPSLYYRNSQSQRFCERLGIRDLNLIFAQASADWLGIPHFLTATPSLEAQQSATTGTAKMVANPDEIELGEDEFGEESFVVDIPKDTQSNE